MTMIVMYIDYCALIVWVYENSQSAIIFITSTDSLGAGKDDNTLRSTRAPYAILTQLIPLEPNRVLL